MRNTKAHTKKHISGNFYNTPERALTWHRGLCDLSKALNFSVTLSPRLSNMESHPALTCVTVLCY